MDAQNPPALVQPAERRVHFSNGRGHFPDAAHLGQRGGVDHRLDGLAAVETVEKTQDCLLGDLRTLRHSFFISPRSSLTALRISLMRSWTLSVRTSKETFRRRSTSRSSLRVVSQSLSSSRSCSFNRRDTSAC